MQFRNENNSIYRNRLHFHFTLKNLNLSFQVKKVAFQGKLRNWQLSFQIRPGIIHRLAPGEIQSGAQRITWW